jgi:chemotaxis protein CheX
MNDQDIHVFISTASWYFASLEEKPSLVIEPPFVREKLGPFLEYTGIIGVTGRYRGVVCFTTTGKMLGEILGLLKERRTDEEAKKDLVGEIANTLSGNAREELGSEFRISVPTVVVGQADELTQRRNDSRNYAIPLNWHSETAYLLVALE